MNSLTRVMTTFKHQEPDRVPITELGVNDLVREKMVPGARSKLEFELAVGYDIIPVRIAYRASDDDGARFTDEWGVRYQRNSEAASYAISHPIQHIDDWRKARIPGADDPYRYANLETVVREVKGERAICFSTRAMFLWAADLCGMENLLVLMLTESGFVADLLDQILESQIKIMQNAVRMGADLIAETDDYAFNTGPLMSPALFDEFIVPRLARYVAAVHQAGVPCIKHTDGNISKILDSIVSAGIDALHSIDPMAGMDIGQVKRQYGDKITLIGNVDCGNLLTYGTTEDVRQAVMNCIRQAAPGGGYILSSSNTIPFSAKPENVRAMIDFTREYGAYPINIQVRR